MPVYEYHCKRCGAKFEKLVRLTPQTAEVECPQVRRPAAGKAVSRFGTVGEFIVVGRAPRRARRVVWADWLSDPAREPAALEEDQ